MPAVLSPNPRMTETQLVAGEVVLDSENPTVLETGLRAVVAVALSLRSSPAPGLGTSVVTYDVVGGLVHLYAWKPTSVMNPTLIASTGTEVVSYVIVGT